MWTGLCIIDYINVCKSIQIKPSPALNSIQNIQIKRFGGHKAVKLPFCVYILKFSDQNSNFLETKN